MLIDITLPLNCNTVHYPGKLPVALRTLMSMKAGDPANCSAVTLDCHVGTHIDAPRHFTLDGLTVDQLDLNTLNGQCRVVEVMGRREVTAQDLEPLQVGERILIKTAGSVFLKSGLGDPNAFSYLTPEAAKLLVRRSAALVAIDSFSIDAYGGAEPCHHILLPAGIPIVECICLDGISPGLYGLLLMPLPLTGAEASPVRAALRPLPLAVPQ